MKNVVINIEWLDHVWSPLGQGNKLRALNTDVPLSVDFLAQAYIKPFFDQLPYKPFHRIKETWRYAINVCDDKTLINAFDSNLPLYNTPKDIRSFYINVWLSVFNNELWSIQDLSVYTLIARENTSPWAHSVYN